MKKIKQNQEVEWLCPKCESLNVHIFTKAGFKYQCQHCDKFFSEKIVFEIIAKMGN